VDLQSIDIKAIAKQRSGVLILFATLALFLITNALLRDNESLNFIPILIAALVVVEIFLLVGMEVKQGANEHGWKHEVVDTVVALLVAVAIWYGASFVLNTSSPVSGVVSCSMLPNLQRGDFIIVQGTQPHAYDISMTKEELAALNSRAEIIYGNGKNASIEGSIFSFCRLQSNDLCSEFVKSPDSILERIGPFTYRYTKCPMSFSNGEEGYQPCLKSVEFKGREYLTNFSNDIVVYQPPKTDLYSMVGDIVHRAMFRIDVDGRKYYLTRGDNNPILDIQAYDYSGGLANHPVPQEQLRGKVIMRVPILGYFKLFIMGYLQEDPQCKTQLAFPHV